jgi:hypothetical protein
MLPRSVGAVALYERRPHNPCRRLAVLHVAPVARERNNPKTCNRICCLADQWLFGILLVFSHQTRVALLHRANDLLVEMLSSYLTRRARNGPVAGPPFCAKWRTRSHRREAQSERATRPRNVAGPQRQGLATRRRGRADQ